MKDAAVLETIGNGERKISVSGIWYMYSKSWFIDFLRLCSNVNSHFTLQIFLAGSEYGQSFFKRGGGVLRMMAYMLYRRGSTGKGYLFQASGVWKGRDFSYAEVFKKVGKSVIWVVEGPKRANRWILWLHKDEKTFCFCDWSLFKRQCIYSS